LGSAKEVIQVGSVIGSQFSYELLHAVHSLSEQDLQRELRKLTDADLLHVRGLAPDATYQFKHALIRDTAYEALLKSRCRELHRLIARTIDEKFPDLKDAHPEVLARHWTQAAENEPAIVEWSRAGKAAEARNAFREAQESYNQAVVLLNQLPESPERDSRELKLRQSVVRTLYVTRGYAAPETIDAREGAAALAEKSANLKQLVDLVLSRCVSALSSGPLLEAAMLADQALDLALREGSPTSLAGAHAVRIIALHFRGDLAGAENHYSAGLVYFDDPGFRQFPGSSVTTLGVASWNAWMLGRADVARERERQMIAATNANNPYDATISGYCAAYLRVCFREYEHAETLVAQALELSEKNQFPQYAAHCRCLLGHARAQLGRPTEGIVLIRQGISGLLETRSPGDISFFSRVWRRRRTAPVPLSVRLKRSNRLSRRIPRNSHTGPRFSEYAANCGLNSDSQN
jgi:tetratricopeptide (TPR) repeat protein